MSARRNLAAPSFITLHTPRFSMGVALIGLALLPPGCSPEGDSAGNARNGAATIPAAAEINPAAAASDARVGDRIADERRTLVAEAVSALQESYAALDLLTAGRADDAAEALARATGKLDVVLAADPSIALAPVEVRVTTHDVIATPDDVNTLRDLAEAALDDGRLQDARHLIAGLASEHVISTVNIPLGSYPAAIKRAAALALAGSTDEASAVLETALATLVVEDLIVPLPLARAEAFLALAEPLAETPQRSDEENARLQKLLTDAQVQIELAQALGYATKQGLEALSDELDAIRDKTRGAGSGVRLFDRIKSLFSQANREANTRPGS